MTNWKLVVLASAIGLLLVGLPMALLIQDEREQQRRYWRKWNLQHLLVEKCVASGGIPIYSPEGTLARCAPMEVTR